MLVLFSESQDISQIVRYCTKKTKNPVTLQTKPDPPPKKQNKNKKYKTQNKGHSSASLVINPNLTCLLDKNKDLKRAASFAHSIWRHTNKNTVETIK